MKTLKTIILMALLAVLVVGLTGCKKKSGPAKTEQMAEKATETAGQMKEAVTEEAAQIEQKACPVMDGNPIDKNVFVEYKGKKVYFCCPACKAKFEADPEKYVANLPQFND